MILKHKWTMVCSALLCVGSVAYAQQPETPRANLFFAFKQLFPHPSGTNGYEELVLAGDLARQNRLLDTASQASATLADKRSALNAPEIRRAMELVRVGMGKEIASPPRIVDEETTFPEFASFRALARLFSVHIYVSFADGQVNAALDNLQAALRLGYHVQASSFISGVVGMTIDTIGLTAIAKHIPQFALRDCDRLIFMMTEWLKLPPPEILILTSERDSVINVLKKNHRDNQKLQGFVMQHQPTYDDGSLPPSKLQKTLENLDTDASEIVEGAVEKITKEYNASIENLKLPFWKHTQSRLADDGSLAYEMADIFTRIPLTVSDRYTQIVAQMHLLAVHATLRKFRWEHDRLPKTLDELKRERDDGLLTDPFTGELLVYKPDGERYELYSVGVPQHDAEGKIIPHSGTPIYLPPLRH